MGRGFSCRHAKGVIHNSPLDLVKASLELLKNPSCGARTLQGAFNREPQPG